MVMSKDARIYVAGHSGLPGSALVAKLSEKGYRRIIARPHNEPDLTDGRGVFGSLSDVRSQRQPARHFKVSGSWVETAFESRLGFKITCEWYKRNWGLS
jgi:nucleoside-diphosphate-sugar epimerase